MALKAGNKPKATPPEEEQKATEEPPVAAAEPETQPPAPEKKAEGRLVKVYNPQIWHYSQPSTGIKVPSKKVTEVRDDGWLANQLKAGVLEKVK